MKPWLLRTLLLLVLSTLAASAELRIKIEDVKRVGNKAVVKLSLRNAFSQRIESARAQVFVVDAEGKVVGQATRWVIGGRKEQASLEPSESRTFSIVVPVEGEFLKPKVTFTQIVLEGGRKADPRLVRLE